ncbi:4Fe-4S dicluster domain-containing protein [Desulfurococcus amylolyticus]|uniref:4Fe-4S dicluster domain-containing protein n=1 Tax=Desulfurococcus amylolyticus TaxID=94694 RepID=UPI0023F482B9|nr:4Fe-4S dicluster domain-containing protein [Desulfurococcus amylolyticus]
MPVKGQLWILVDYNLCTDCRLCEIACSLKHENMIWPEASRIKVYEPYPGVPVPSLCVQCPDYPCVNSCPTKALRVNEATGGVTVDTGLCTLCGKCVEACPGRIPRIVKGVSHVLICDLCGGDPECVKACNMAGYNALRVVGKPASSVVKLYARPPGIIAEELRKKVLG